MPSNLNLFPVRVPIGTVTDENGKTFDVMMTREFATAMSGLMTRVGGPISLTVEELATLVATDPGENAALAVLQRLVVDLAAQLEVQTSVAARVGVLERRLEELAQLAYGTTAPPVDWEHPGKIGASKANSGAFTTLTTSGKTQLNPANADVEAKPTGTGTVTIKPALAAGGQIDNMELGNTTPKPARVTTLNKVTVTQPATGATLTLSDGTLLKVRPGATFEVDAPGGVTGTAAYKNVGDFPAKSATPLGGPATDPATTQALANTMRAVLISVGIGT